MATQQQQDITVETEGSRVYLIGRTFPIKEEIKNAGGKWDRDRGAWYLGREKKHLAEQLAGQRAGSDRNEPAPPRQSAIPYDDRRDPQPQANPRQQHQANTRIIAAELLEELKAIVDEREAALQRAKAVIAKAESVL